MNNKLNKLFSSSNILADTITTSSIVSNSSICTDRNKNNLLFANTAIFGKNGDQLFYANSEFYAETQKDSTLYNNGDLENNGFINSDLLFFKNQTYTGNSTIHSFLIPIKPILVVPGVYNNQTYVSYIGTTVFITPNQSFSIMLVNNANLVNPYNNINPIIETALLPCIESLPKNLYPVDLNPGINYKFILSEPLSVGQTFKVQIKDVITNTAYFYGTINSKVSINVLAPPAPPTLTGGLRTITGNNKTITFTSTAAIGDSVYVVLTGDDWYTEIISVNGGITCP